MIANKNVTGAGQVWTRQVSERMDTTTRTWGEKVADAIQKWNVLPLLMGFLLGRALILEELTPFVIPYFIVMFYIRRDCILTTGFALILGAFTQSVPVGLQTILSVVLSLVVCRIMERTRRKDFSRTPILVVVTVFISHLLYAALTNQVNTYELVMVAVEAVLGFVLTLIFIQSLSIIHLAKPYEPLKNEEIVSLVILLASLMTGTVDWMVEGISMEHVLSRYLLLVFAFVGGGTIGAAVGVVTGLILSLANVSALLQINLLAFSGLLAGLLKEGGKVGVSAGLLIGSAILAIYGGAEETLYFSLVETSISIALFILTPAALWKKVARFIPGTPENLQSHQEYMRRVRDVTAGKIQQFSDLFTQLSHSFALTADRDEIEEQADAFLSRVTEFTCQKCWKKEQCWEKDMQATYEGMRFLMDKVYENGTLAGVTPPRDWERKCVKTEKVMTVIEQEYDRQQSFDQLKKQVKESRKLVADQLSGVSRVMSDFAREIQREGMELSLQEKQVSKALEGLGLSVRRVDIHSLEEGKVDIEISQPTCYGRDECAKIVAPMLTEILGENIVVRQRHCEAQKDGSCTMCLASAKTFEIDIGVAGAAKDGKLLSGDSFRTMDLGNGKMALAISDGMGNGERASLESQSALDMLQQLLRSGMDEKISIKTVNSVLALRSTEEMFATVDLALIDLQTAHTRFIKIGSTPSFVKRSHDVITITANNLPVGILDEIEVDVVSRMLKPGDLLIMMSDGIYEAPRHIENRQVWMKRIISELETDDPQEVADLLLEKVIRQHSGKIVDDMTVLVARIDRFVPQWAAIQVHGMPKLERPRIVS
ncbi:stage II sporulation protein E [Brevibacillus reuszeri]|uniref:Stage II sporulation protein E n=1 Tax=Brevibacillus reuszeri TaxID=54915 RepID=A0A0K9YIC0_9BACL|nr:stage II sporulation protein E [Brevibacillus reuszeri]KNB68422.1 stage II sporulation protein E [Brevibacillus reuszeri]MED1861103.1 stage II sporulation protein E [Brevibacillus reuszeri]GED72023.1 stage II sporulation protein E [Brevibacillus reuszeri]